MSNIQNKQKGCAPPFGMAWHVHTKQNHVKMLKTTKKDYFDQEMAFKLVEIPNIQTFNNELFILLEKFIRSGC